MSEDDDAIKGTFGAVRRDLASGETRSYVRFAALGDSASHGVGDPVGDGWRGWARLLASAVAVSNDLSFCNLATSGATAADVRAQQLSDAIAHKPHIASLVVGLNDTMRSTWHPRRFRDDLLHCADELVASGAELLTVRFHDHSRVFHLPRILARPLRQRIDVVNAAYDEIWSHYGGIRVDLAAHPEVYRREFWAVDRLHPSERGHRFLANEFARLVANAGLPCASPGLTPGAPPSRMRNAHWMVANGAPWIGRRARDLAPLVVRSMLGRPAPALPA